VSASGIKAVFEVTETALVGFMINANKLGAATFSARYGRK
jgi:hypothetical protein